MTWSQKWFDAIADRKFASKESYKMTWQAARLYYQFTGNVRLFKDFPLRFWSLAYEFWQCWRRKSIAS